MVRVKHVISLLIGIVLGVMVLWNVSIGFYQTYSDGVMHKLVLTMLFSGTCSEATIAADLESFGVSACLSPLGVWEPVDVVVIGIAFLLVRRGLSRVLKGSGQVSEESRKARRWIRASLLFGSVGVADMFGMLTSTGEVVDLADLLGFDLPGPALASFLLATSATCMVVGVSLLRSSAGRGRKQRGGGKRAFIGSAEKHLGEGFTVGQLREALSLDQYEDPFQKGIEDDDMGMTIGKSCHYCNGQGCNQCDGTGTLA